MILKLPKRKLLRRSPAEPDERWSKQTGLLSLWKKMSKGGKINKKNLQTPKYSLLEMLQELVPSYPTVVHSTQSSGQDYWSNTSEKIYLQKTSLSKTNFR